MHFDPNAHLHITRIATERAVEHRLHRHAVDRRRRRALRIPDWMGRLRPRAGTIGAAPTGTVAMTGCGPRPGAQPM